MIGNAQRAAGGLNQVTIPAQSQSMVQGQWTGYGGGFNSPVVTPGIQNLQFNLAYWVVPVPLPFGETIIQATEREISLLKARMNDVFATTRQNMATLLYTNNTANPLQPDSFVNGFDNGTNVPTYGGINRLAQGNSPFKGQYIDVTAGGTAYSLATVNTLGFTRTTMSTFVSQVTDAAGGEAPTFIVMSPGDYATLNNSFISLEQLNPVVGNPYNMDTQVRSSFPNLVIAGVPVFNDHFCPKGQMFAVNCKYTAMYLSEDAAFDFSGFYSLVPLGQIGQQGVTVVGYDVLTAKPSSNAIAVNIGGAQF
jgi:hypothetical protein